MRVLIITEEDEFYLPLSIDYLLKNCDQEVMEVVIARNPLTPGKYITARKFYRAFGLIPILSHSLRLLKVKLIDRLTPLKRSGRHYSVERLCKAHRMPFLYVAKLNSPDFLQHVRQLNPDLIAAVSPTQIFKKDLINIPRHGCINIHTAKLPQYRGLYPVYWAMASAEKTVGISIHYIEQEIDTGKIILQDELEIPPAATLDYMLNITKIKGAKLLVKAIAQIDSGKIDPHYARGKGSYFSFPTRQSYQQFKRLGYKLW